MDKTAGKKRVVITGCSSGFGMLAAVEAAKAGFEVVATMRNLDKSAGLKELAAAKGAEIKIERLDVTNGQEIGAIAEKYRPVDILVNNAGILIMGSCIDISEKEMRRVFETNYWGAVNLTRAVVPGMLENGGGLVINIASLAGRVGHLYNAAYSASKHALIGFSRSIRMELKPFNIKVVSVEPGYHKTEIIRANANLCERFYDRGSAEFQYNRGFLRLMMKEILPRADEPGKVVKKIIEIMQSERPKNHYIIGKDAWFAMVARRLGLLGLVEKKAYEKLLRNTARENERDAQRKERSKK